jgi:hypothetical protein
VASTKFAQNFAGNSAPEPATWAGLLVIFLAALVFYKRRQLIGRANLIS